MKACTKCKVEKNFSEFYKHPNKKDGLQSWCKLCIVDKTNLEYIRKWKTQNPDLVAHQHRKFVYGISKEEYTRILENQCGLCAICSTELDKGINNHLDHCHHSNNVRGILCGSCNKGLGMFKDNVEYLQNAIDYLKEHQE